MKELWELIKAVVTSPAGLVAILGFVLVGLGAAGGVTYKEFFVIADPSWRKFLAGLGTLLIIASVVKLLIFGDRKVKDAVTFNTLGIKIVNPLPGPVPGGRVDVRITSEKPIPPGYELVVLRGYPKEDGVLPNSRLHKNVDSLEWNAMDFEIGGAIGETRTIQAWIIGPDGKALLSTWERDHEVHSETISELRRVGATANPPPKIRWLKSIIARTADMHLCASIKVNHA